jgi:hypothetical protein
MKYLEKHLSLPLLQRLLAIFTAIFILSFILLFMDAANAQPANDNCANATVLTVGAGCTSGTNTAATLQAGEPTAAGCWLSAVDRTVWYRFTTGAAGTYVITTDNGSTTDTQLKLYSSACGVYTEIACNDDAGVTNALSAVMEAALAASTQYWIQVDVYGTTQAAFCIRVASAPLNSICASATVLTVNAACTNGTNVNASIQAGEPTALGCWGTDVNQTVWYTFTTTSAGPYVISTDNGGTTDTQMKLYSGGCGVYTLVACSEDNGVVNGFAAVIAVTLPAATQYWVQIDVWDPAAGTFCINVYQPTRPTNDCITDAIDISFLINPVSPTNPYDCQYDYTYNRSISTADDPTRQDIIGDANGCNGQVVPPPPILAPHPIHMDIWFKFTVSGTTPDAYLHLFPVGGTAIMEMGLYSGTPTTTCPTGSISGLTQIDCSVGELVAIPPFNTYGGARDKSICSTPIHPRLDIGNLALGTYYIRVWDFHGGTDTIPDPPGTGVFTLCAESTDPRPYTSDTCTTYPNIGYTGADSLNVDVNLTYTTLSNAGNHGNTYGGPSSFVCPSLQPNEPFLGATPSGEARIACAGGWVNYVGGINNIMNVTVIHSFLVNNSVGCEPTCLITFNNMVTDGTPGNVAQIQVMAPGNCTGSTQTIMNTQTNASCLQIRPLGNASLPCGMYYIVVDGQDGQMIQYDLTLTLNYPCDPVAIDSFNIGCGPIGLPIELLTFKGENRNGVNYLKWITATEINNDHFELERSQNGTDFILIRTIDGAGNSTNPRQYFASDATAPNGISYYRLKQVDYDGAFSYSNIIAVKNAGSIGTLSIESMDEVSLLADYNSLDAQHITLRLIDIRGNILRNDGISIAKGINQFRVNTDNLQRGIYILEAIDHSGNSSKVRFVK